MQVKCTGKLYACKKTCKKRMKKNHAEKLVHIEKLTLESVNRCENNDKYKNRRSQGDERGHAQKNFHTKLSLMLKI